MVENNEQENISFVKFQLIVEDIKRKGSGWEGRGFYSK